MFGSILGSMAYWPSGLHTSTSVGIACKGRPANVLLRIHICQRVRRQQTLAARLQRDQLTVGMGMIRSTQVGFPI